MNLDLSKDVAVVVGGAGVLGGKLAEGLAGSGAKIAILDLHAGRGDACVQLIRKAGGDARFFTADATSHESLSKASEQIEAAFGPPTVLLNAAGGNNPKVTVADGLPFEKISLQDWRSHFDLNLIGGIMMPCQVFGPGMVARGHGSIINIASVSAHIPLSRVVAYSASKAALLNLTRFLAREWAPHNVRVNSITPGFFAAEQNRSLLYNEDGSPSARTKTILAHTPMGRFGQPEELVGAVLFLACSHASSFVTGSDLRIDGGFLAQTI